MNTFFTLTTKRTLGRSAILFGVVILPLLLLSSGLLYAQSALNSSTPGKIKYASISQFVFIDIDANGKKDAFDIPLPNSTVSLYDSSNNLIATKITNSNGYFFFDSIEVPAIGFKSFRLKFASPSGDYIFTAQNATGSENGNGSIADQVSGLSPLFKLEAGQARTDLNAGFKPSAGVLFPVTLNQFTGAYANGFVELSWKALVNASLKQFDIERSTDGVNFRQIGQVVMDEDNTSNTSFTFLDILAEKGANFYRLVLVDKDGNYTYSKVLTISVEAKGVTLMVVYPNPFSKRVQIKIDCDKAEQVTIRVVDNSGNVARTQTANLQKGENRMAINNVDDLPSGFYYLEVIAKDRKMRIKLMKQL